MALDRLITVGAVSGLTMLNQLQEELTGLWDRSIIKLGTIGGTADAITAVATPALTGALVDGMRFTVTPAANNTSSTLMLSLDGGTTNIAIKDRDGNALAPGDWKSGRTHLLEYQSSIPAFRVLDHLPAASQQPTPDFRNILWANGGLEIWQRGAGGSASISVAASTTAYTADRWYLTTGSNQASVVSEQTGLTDRSRKCARVQRNSGQTGTGSMVFAYPLTTEECVRMRGQKVALQFVASAGANWSPASGTLTYNVYFGTAAEGKRGAGFTGETNPLSGSVNLTAGGAAQSVSGVSAGTVATNVTQGEIRFTWTPSGTASTNDWFQIDDVQAEAAAAVTLFEYLPFELMLQGCLRDYCKTFPYNTAPAQNVGVRTGCLVGRSAGDGGTVLAYPLVMWRFPKSMRTSPTIVTYNPHASNTDWSAVHAGGSATVQVDVGAIKSADVIMIDSTSSGSAAAAGNLQLHYIHATADAGL